MGCVRQAFEKVFGRSARELGMHMVYDVSVGVPCCWHAPWHAALDRVPHESCAGGYGVPSSRPPSFSDPLCLQVAHNVAKEEEHTLPDGRRWVIDGGAAGIGLPIVSTTAGLPLLNLAPHDRRVRVLVHRKGATRAFPPHHPEIPKKYRVGGRADGTG